MKKTILAVFICIISISASAQTLGSKTVSTPDSATLAYLTTKNAAGYQINHKSSKEVARSVNDSTLEILDVKYIKIGNKTIPTELLKQDGLYVTMKDFSQLIGLLGDFPAKCANPVTELIMRFFGLKPKE